MAWLAEVLERIISGRTKATRPARLLPWNWRAGWLAAVVRA